MPEPPTKLSKLLPFLFSGICLAGLASMIFFARSATLQSAPAYSTLNTGPDGAALLFDGLKQAGIVQLARQYKSISLEKPHNSAVLFLGIDPLDLVFADHSYFDEVERSAENGNDLILAVLDTDISDSTVTEKHFHALKDRWGVRFLPSNSDDRSNIQVDRTWTARPDLGSYVWQRKFARGSVILVGRGQRLGNRQMAADIVNRQLLIGLVERHPSAIFEEAHFGIHETGSIMGLARHYHLQGLLAGLILLAGLYVWNRSVSFPPAPAAQEKALMGSDTRSMLAELMSRHLKGQLIKTCVSEWNRTRGLAPALEIPEEANAVAAYQKLQTILQEKTKYRK